MAFFEGLCTGLAIGAIFWLYERYWSSAATLGRSLLKRVQGDAQQAANLIHKL